MTTNAQSQPDFWGRLGRFLGRLLGFLLRLLFILLLAVAIGAGVYYGLPWLYATLVQPVQANTTQIQAITSRLETMRTGIDQSQAAQDGRLTTLETAGDDQRLRLQAAETAVSDMQTALTSQQADTQATVAAEAAARDELAAQMAALQTELDDQAAAAAALQAQVQPLASAASAADKEIAGLKQQLALLRIENGLLHARLQLTAENLGEVRLQLADSAAALDGYLNTPGALTASDQASLVVRLSAAQALIEPEPANALAELESIAGQLDRLLNPPATP